ncbi:hypothetical protein TM49_18145 [Martelella endophytica]|uniref:Porin n=2 Tax=Martelella endophytica TaxID=1486262 RepID=A0A0D5LSH6_MAREN|nr:hypothetical protein TM49_18145 [Martelella endophytica]
MNVKSLLLGSAAAFAAASGAQAADPVVVIEPVAANYVEVCDAFGAGFFYIPGTETCLDFGGYIRFQVDFETGDAARLSDGDWGSWTRGHLDITSKTDTELGTLTGVIKINAEYSSNTYFNGSGVKLDQTYLGLGGFQAGYFTSYWDDGLVGEIDDLSGETKFNSMRYGIVADGFIAGLSVDALSPSMISYDYTPASNHVGFSSRIGFAAGGVDMKLDGGYDTYNEEGSLRLMAGFALGPGELNFGAQWASGWNAYANKADDYFGPGAYSDWAVAVGYGLNVSDKFKVTPAFQYTHLDDTAAGIEADSYWQGGALFEYEIVDGLAAKLNLQYYKADDADDQDLFNGWFRLQRDF